ncbi:MAG TPA: endonuclease [Bacteroidales bacterium]|nr:endonuclease [Bacteroidales bacterium]HPS62931.1 endonuclease [Bacteroidales bacterium]
MRSLTPSSNHTFTRRAKSLLLPALLFFTLVAWGTIPPGYYNGATGKTGEALQIALYDIIKGHTVVSYTPGVWNAFYSTDKKANGKVWDMYTDIPGGTPVYEFAFGSDQCGSGGGGTEGDCYSREHSFPKSWFNDDPPMNTDLHHIFPTDQYVNNMHSNYPFAVVGTATATSSNGSKKGSCATLGYSGIVFEPIDAYKGDFARAYFYMATRYENVIATWYAYDPYADAVLNGTSYPAFETWYLNLLISWHEQDPVSAKEIARNDSIYKIQGNRNPYIDHPEYVEAVWMPSGNVPEPTNHVTGFAASTGTPPYSAINLSWTDATGTVIPGGYLVRGSLAGFSAIATPVDGTPVANGPLDKNIGSGVQQCTFTDLLPDTTYYFKIFPFTNAGSTIDYKTSGTVPTASKATTPPSNVLQPGDIAIVEFSPLTIDKFSFVALTQLNAGTTINFTDNGYASPTTVYTNEGSITWIAPTIIAPGTVISWYFGMPLTGTGWNTSTPSQFSLSTSGDQIFAYQGIWGSGHTLICGINAGNSGWVTSGSVGSTTSYLPAVLTAETNAITFPEKNGYYNLISSATPRVFRCLAANPVNWVRSATVLSTPVWGFNTETVTDITVDATISVLEVGSDEILTVEPGINLTVTGNMTIY